ncbi:sulfatase [Halosquirtibacter xylanolyticus]|uniref:sulfatase family protein n=1 Tax=Halosquirtibacter xylanolyticus TaxID=3374599 RepID=UPI003748F734|nr:sulfatase [Prolixibacteraceae bacterium]
MSRIKLLGLGLCGLLGWNVQAKAPKDKKEERPNFIILLGDDISSNSLGCYGSPNKGTSPNIDNLASHGVMFTNMFVTEAICAPTRAELYTGKQPFKNGVYVNHNQTYKGTKSVVHYLSDLGYRVGLTGKRHFGPKSVYPFEMIQALPQNCNARDVGVADWSNIRKFIKRNDQEPFCLFLCSVQAHSPWDSGDPSPWRVNDLVLPKNLVDTRQTRMQYREYLAEVKLFDDQVGRVNTMMKELKIDKNTVFIVLDENGAGMPTGKWSNYDWGVRSACVMKWPKKYKINDTKSDAIAQYCDILPTLIDAAGGERIIDLDGQSLLPLLKQKKSKHRDYAYFTYNSGPVGPAYPIRAITDGKYKLINNMMPDTLFGAWTINGFQFGKEDPMLDRPERLMYLSWLQKAKKDSTAAFLVKRFRDRPSYELYDLDNDPHELNNLIQESSLESKISSLKIELERWKRSQGDLGIQAEQMNDHH